MDAEEELKVDDAEKFDAVLVGGILGEPKPSPPASFSMEMRLL